MAQNYLSGPDSPQINAFLAATGWSLKKMMKQLKSEVKLSLIQIFEIILTCIFPKMNLSC